MLEKLKKDLDNEGKIHIKARIKAGAPKDGIVGMLADNTLKISIASPPENGKANKRLVALLAKAFDVLPKSVKIISGTSSKNKLLKIIRDN